MMECSTCNEPYWKCICPARPAALRDFYIKDQNVSPARKPLIYLGGSMRNREEILTFAKWFGDQGFDPFTDWLAPGEETDDKWQDYARTLDMDYLTALESAHAHNVYDFDRKWLDRSEALISIGNPGRSAMAEIGYMAGKGKPVGILLPPHDPDRFDIMILFAAFITKDEKELVTWLKNAISQPSTV